MNILVLDPRGDCLERVRALPLEWEDVSVVAMNGSAPASAPFPPADVIVASGDFANGADVTGSLLKLRTHPHTCLVPCWIAGEAQLFERRCFWPRLAIDSFRTGFDSVAFSDWLEAVGRWQHDRTLIRESASLVSHGPLEILNSLALRKATGRLSIFDRDGGEGFMLFREGQLVDGRLRLLTGTEVFHEFLTWNQGSYHWDPDTEVGGATGAQSIPLLIQEGLNLVQEANLLFSLIGDVHQALEKTESEAALDDGGVPYYTALKQLYSLIAGKVTVADLLDASPLSRPRTMIALTKWLSLEDIRPTDLVPATPPCRLLIVDDSPLMRRALLGVFAVDTRFQVVGSAENGVEALRLVEQLKPDVITMDLQMPLMDGLTALKHIMVRQPLPVVVLSAFTGQASPLTYQSFKYGAVDVLAKPAAKGSGAGMSEQAREIRDRVLQACGVRMEAARVIRRMKKQPSASYAATAPSPARMADARPRYALITLVCGAGGFPLFLKLTGALSRGWSLPPILACLTFPTQVIEALLPNLQADSEMDVELLRPEAPLKPGIIHLYSNELCCRLSWEGPGIRVREGEGLSDAHRPFDVCLESAAETFKDELLALLLSGAGEDGVEGMKRVSDQGGSAYVLAPDACLNPELPEKVLSMGLAKGVGSVSDMVSVLGGLFDDAEGCGAD